MLDNILETNIYVDKCILCKYKKEDLTGLKFCSGIASGNYVVALCQF